jgi:hypothetical protein
MQYFCIRAFLCNILQVKKTKMKKNQIPGFKNTIITLICFEIGLCCREMNDRHTTLFSTVHRVIWRNLIEKVSRILYRKTTKYVASVDVVYSV